MAEAVVEESVGGPAALLLSCACDIDPRERLVVGKLQRSQLEDRYLRLLEQAHALKKLSNSQEDKIKRLATKLMRFGAGPASRPSSCLSRLELADERDRLSLLEAENAKLRNRVCLLRNQLTSQKMFPSASSRRASLPLGTSSGPATCRSENSRGKAAGPASAAGSCKCASARVASTIADENDLQNYSLKIQDMEAEKKEMLAHIAELELELANLTSGSRRERVAENVEHIRLWRQMKRQGEKLAAAQAANELLSKQVCQLKRHLDDCSKSREQASAALAAERRQLADLDDSAARLEESQLNVREREDRIADLVKEIGILQQHNRELLELSSKFGKVEQENVDLKRKIAEQLAEYQSLKDSLSHEKANVTALQEANDRLLVKLHELQKNIDLMTIQLMEQNNKTAVTRRTNKRANHSLSLTSEDISDSSKKLSTSRTDGGQNSSIDDYKDSKTLKFEQQEKGIQTSEAIRESTNRAIQTDQLILQNSAKLSENEASDENCKKQKNNNNDNTNNYNNNGRNNLSREGMLKLLEQVQISTPLESQNATIMRHKDAASFAFTVPRQTTTSSLETFLFGDSSF